jgi:hypothetical protein
LESELVLLVPVLQPVQVQKRCQQQLLWQQSPLSHLEHDLQILSQLELRLDQNPSAQRSELCSRLVASYRLQQGSIDPMRFG